jgi:hypothetical protein
VTAIVRETMPDTLLEYGGFPDTAGSGMLSAPLIAADNFGSFTGIQVQNAGATATEVTITYTGNTADPTAVGAKANCGTGRVGWVPAADTFTVPKGGSVTRIQRWTAGNPALNAQEDEQFESCRYIGSATISAPGGKLVAIVNQANHNPEVKAGSAYEAVDVAKQDGVVGAALITGNNNDKDGSLSGIQIQNLSGAEVSVSVVYGQNVADYAWPGRTFCRFPGADPLKPLVRPYTIPANTSKTILIGPKKADSPDADEQFQSCTYVGSATVSTTGASAGSPLAVLVNQAGPGAGDQLSTYVGE